MPELPEVETTRRGLAPHLVGRTVVALAIRQPRLRWPVPRELRALLPGQRIEGIERRAKYLLVHTEPGSALLHLGMSGSLRVLPAATPAGIHDHVDWRLDSGHVLRYTDPGRPRPFRTPLVPLVPIAGIAACVYLMSGLPVDTWARLIIWMAIGLVIYFLYGRRHSKVQLGR